MKAHFDPYFHTDDLDYDSKTMCGVIYPEFDPYGTSVWDDVTCKRCIRMKEKLKIQYSVTEQQIVNQMGDMAAYMEENK